MWPMCGNSAYIDDDGDDDDDDDGSDDDDNDDDNYDHDDDDDDRSIDVSVGHGSVNAGRWRRKHVKRNERQT